MAADQSARAPFPLGAPPLHVLYVDRDDRQKKVMRSLFGLPGDDARASTEVVVKNTFLHVEDVAQPVMRSRSESDLGSNTSSSQSDKRLLSSSGIEHTPRSTSPASSTTERPVGLSHPKTRRPAPGSASSASSTTDRPVGAAHPSARSHDPGSASSASSAADRPVGLAHPKTRRHAPGIASSAHSTNDGPRRGNESSAPSHAPGVAANSPGAFSYAPRLLSSTNAVGEKPCGGGDFSHVQAPAGVAYDRPNSRFFSSIPSQASGSARCTNDRAATGANLTAPWPSSMDDPFTDVQNDFPTAEEFEEQDAAGERSAGSANHDAGDCKPCMYYGTSKGCRNGSSCMFCHLPHRQQYRARPSKSKREHCKQIVRMLGDFVPEDPQRMIDAVCRSNAGMCSTNKEKAYLLSILEAKAQRQHEERREQFEVDPSAGRSTPSDVRQQPARPFKMRL